MKTATLEIAFCLTLATLLLPGAAGADLCQFGYADAAVVGDGAPTLGWSAAQSAGVPQDSGRIIPLDGAVQAHTRDIRSHIQSMNAAGIRPLVDITDVVWSPTPLVNPNCGTEYERGNLRNASAWSRQAFKSNWSNKLDDFLDLNANELGTDSIRGFIVHIEVNNNCVPAWRVNTVASVLESQGYGPDDGYLLAGGYGLTYPPTASPNGISTGMPTGLFPAGLTHVTPWAYDVQGLWTNSVYNFNVEVTQLGVTGFWNKLVGKLRTGQQVIWGFTGLCQSLQEQMFNGPHLAPQDRLGTDCTPTPTLGTWPIASIANHWRWFAEAQPRMDGLIAIQWTGPSGTNVLDPVVTDNQKLVGNSALTCE